MKWAIQWNCNLDIHSFQIEFAVQMKAPNASEAIRNLLKDYGTVDVDESSGRVTINTDAPWIDIQEKIEETGRRAVLSGFGGIFASS